MPFYDFCRQIFIEASKWVQMTQEMEWLIERRRLSVPSDAESQKLDIMKRELFVAPDLDEWIGNLGEALRKAEQRRDESPPVKI